MIISLTGAHSIRHSCASLFKIIPTPLCCISSATEYRFTSPVTSPVEVRTLPEPNYLASLTPKMLRLKHLISFTTLTVANIACTFQHPILNAHLSLAIETLRSRTSDRPSPVSSSVKLYLGFHRSLCPYQAKHL